MNPLAWLEHPGAISERVMGNIALVRAFLETQTRVVTSYPGSPTPEIASGIHAIPPERRPFHFEFSVNEKVATEVALGASLNGHLSAVFFKSVGLNVAADAFVQLNHMTLPGGMVVVIGDDPGCHSSQNEQDNRHLARLSYTPLLEPGSPEEIYRFYLRAAELARKHQMAIILRLSTHTCHQEERVSFGPLPPPSPPGPPLFDPARGPYLPVTQRVFPMKARALRQLEAVRQEADTPRHNTLWGSLQARRGIITSGWAFLSLMDLLDTSPPPPVRILKLDMPFPLPREQVLAFCRSCDEVWVLEDLDDFTEQNLRALLQKEGLACTLHGKTELDDWLGEATPAAVRRRLNRLWPDLCPVATIGEPPPTPAPDPRPPQLCPGCGHRSAFTAIAKALRPQDITVGDIGCHTLGFLPPHRMGQVLLCMGASPSLAAGLRLFQTERKVLAFIGDSTLFHAGIPGLINLLFNQHPVTLVIMENQTTAMTGHQNHPGTGAHFDGPSPRIDLPELLAGMGIHSVRRVDAYQQARLTEAVKEALAEDGPSVVIAHHPCMLQVMKKKRRDPAYSPRRVRVDPRKCTLSRDCLNRFGCPSFQPSPDADSSPTVHRDLCIGDGSCLQVCPAQAIDRPQAESGEEA